MGIFEPPPLESSQLKSSLWTYLKEIFEPALSESRKLKKRSLAICLGESGTGIHVL